MLIIISLGGSVLAQDFSGTYIKNYADILSEISKKHKIIVVTGGGLYARKYIQLARNLGANESECDLFGIKITKVNAQLLITAINKICDRVSLEIPNSYNQAINLLKNNNIVIMGGITPGQTTDAVASIVAEYTNADLLLVSTSVDGVYSDDPNINYNAIKYDNINIKKILSMSINENLTAGSKSPIDPIACKIIERSKINTIIFDGKQISNLIFIINNKDEILQSKKCINGTVIEF